MLPLSTTVELIVQRTVAVDALTLLEAATCAGVKSGHCRCTFKKEGLGAGLGEAASMIHSDCGARSTTTVVRFREEQFTNCVSQCSPKPKWCCSRAEE